MIALLRIDERLIHGQVATSWSKALDIDTIVCASDEAAQNPLKNCSAAGQKDPCSQRGRGDRTSAGSARRTHEDFFADGQPQGCAETGFGAGTEKCQLG